MGEFSPLVLVTYPFDLTRQYNMLSNGKGKSVVIHGV